MRKFGWTAENGTESKWEKKNEIKWMMAIEYMSVPVLLKRCIYKEVLSCWKPYDNALQHTVKKKICMEKKKKRKKKGILSETYSHKMLETKIHPINTSFKTKSTDMANYLHVFFYSLRRINEVSGSSRSQFFFLTLYRCL